LVKLAFSYWNIAEAAVVFDKYERRLGLNARRLLSSLLSESTTLSRLQSAREKLRGKCWEIGKSLIELAELRAQRRNGPPKGTR
jgi:hypothetical protein